MDSKVKNEYLESQLLYTTQQLAIQFSPWMPLMNGYHHKEVLGYTAIGSDWHSPQTKSNDNCHVETSEELKSAKTHDCTQLLNAAIKCYVCDQHVIKSEFALHLFFGALKCNDCQIKIIDCKSFRSDCFMSSNCTHKNISWLDNPLEYLKSHVNKTSKSATKKVYRYVKCLKSLEQLLPWKSAFQEYRRLRKLNSNSKIKCEPIDCKTFKRESKGDNTNNSNCTEVLLLESYDLDQMEEAVQVIGLVDHEIFQENHSNVKSELTLQNHNNNGSVEQTFNKDLNNSYVNDQNISNVGNRNINSEKLFNLRRDIDNRNDIVPPGKVNLFDNPTRALSIKNAVENILLKDKLKKIKSEKGINFKQKQNIKNKCNDKKKILNLSDIKQLKNKRRKHKTINVKTKIINQFIEVTKPNTFKESMEKTFHTNPEIELLDLPEDGNYLVTKTPIEECPMCYTKISIYNCRVNIKLLLFKFWCQCGLKIFYLPKTPANLEHPVKIIENKL